MNHYSELYGEFVVPNKRLYDLAMEYHTRAEQYDQTICENGIPKTSNQMYKINKNAKIILDEIGVREKLDSTEYQEFREMIRFSIFPKTQK